MMYDVENLTMNGQRWICIRMDALGGLFAAGLAAYMVYYRTSVDASDTGFSLTMAVTFSGGIIWVSHSIKKENGFNEKNSGCAF